jgi:hypothetical protein
MRRLLCWLLGGHLWGEWQEVVWKGWDTNMKPQARYCGRCWSFELNRAAQILTALATSEQS